MNSDSHEDHPSNNQARNTTSPRIQEDCYTQVAEEIEGTDTKKLSQELSRTTKWNLGALSRLNKYVLHSLRTHSGDISEFKRGKPKKV